jgi:hypothetical protein
MCVPVHSFSSRKLEIIICLRQVFWLFRFLFPSRAPQADSGCSINKNAIPQKAESELQQRELLLILTGFPIKACSICIEQRHL